MGAVLEDEPQAEAHRPLAAGRSLNLPERVAGGGGAEPGVRIAPPDRVGRVVHVDVNLGVALLAAAEALEQRRIQFPEARAFRTVVTRQVSLRRIRRLGVRLRIEVEQTRSEAAENR